MFIYEKAGLKVLPYCNNRYVYNDESKMLFDKTLNELVKPDSLGVTHLSDTIYGALDFEELWMLTQTLRRYHF